MMNGGKGIKIGLLILNLFLLSIFSISKEEKSGGGSKIIIQSVDLKKVRSEKIIWAYADCKLVNHT